MKIERRPFTAEERNLVFGIDFAHWPAETQLTVNVPGGDAPDDLLARHTVTLTGKDPHVHIAADYAWAAKATQLGLPCPSPRHLLGWSVRLGHTVAQSDTRGLYTDECFPCVLAILAIEKLNRFMATLNYLTENASAAYGIGIWELVELSPWLGNVEMLLNAFLATPLTFIPDSTAER